jgi:hypothetical protein
MLDALARMSRRPGVYIAAAIVTVIVVVATTFGSSGHHSNSATTTSTTDAFFGTTTTAVGSSTTPPSTISASTAEIDRPGDPANPGQLYPGRPDLRDNDHERAIGPASDPARLGGYSAWVVESSINAKGPDGTPGPYLRLVVRLVNRDDSAQTASVEQWHLLRPDSISVGTAFATPALASGIKIAGNGEQFAELWFATKGPGRYWLSFRPDQASARGVWAIDVAS